MAGFLYELARVIVRVHLLCLALSLPSSSAVSGPA